MSALQYSFAWNLVASDAAQTKAALASTSNPCTHGAENANTHLRCTHLTLLALRQTRDADALFAGFVSLNQGLAIGTCNAHPLSHYRLAYFGQVGLELRARLLNLHAGVLHRRNRFGIHFL